MILIKQKLLPLCNLQYKNKNSSDLQNWFSVAQSPPFNQRQTLSKCSTSPSYFLGKPLGNMVLAKQILSVPRAKMSLLVSSPMIWGDLLLVCKVLLTPIIASLIPCSSLCFKSQEDIPWKVSSPIWLPLMPRGTFLNASWKLIQKKY